MQCSKAPIAGLLVKRFHVQNRTQAVPAVRRAVYYERVLEIPTPRWSTFDAKKRGVAPPKSVLATIQERAWSSPTWYTPIEKNRQIGAESRRRNPPPGPAIFYTKPAIVS